MCAALAPARDGDEPRAAELTEDATDDDGMYADAPRERFARRWLVFAEEIDTDEDVTAMVKRLEICMLYPPLFDIRIIQ